MIEDFKAWAQRHDWFLLKEEDYGVYLKGGIEYPRFLLSYMPPQGRKVFVEYACGEIIR